jgi:hypothetical protein
MMRIARTSRFKLDVRTASRGSSHVHNTYGTVGSVTTSVTNRIGNLSISQPVCFVFWSSEIEELLRRVFGNAACDHSDINFGIELQIRNAKQPCRQRFLRLPLPRSIARLERRDMLD